VLTYQDVVAILSEEKYAASTVYVPVTLDYTRTARARGYEIRALSGRPVAVLGIERLDLPGAPCHIFSIQLTHNCGDTLMRLEFGRAHTCPDKTLIEYPHLHTDDDPYPPAWDGCPLNGPEDTLVIVRQFLKRAGIDGRVESQLLWH